MYIIRHDTFCNELCESYKMVTPLPKTHVRKKSTLAIMVVNFYPHVNDVSVQKKFLTFTYDGCENMYLFFGLHHHVVSTICIESFLNLFSQIPIIKTSLLFIVVVHAIIRRTFYIFMVLSCLLDGYL